MLWVIHGAPGVSFVENSKWLIQELTGRRTWCFYCFKLFIDLFNSVDLHWGYAIETMWDGSGVKRVLSLKMWQCGLRGPSLHKTWCLFHKWLHMNKPAVYWPLYRKYFLMTLVLNHLWCEFVCTLYKSEFSGVVPMCISVNCNTLFYPRVCDEVLFAFLYCPQISLISVYMRKCIHLLEKRDYCGIGSKKKGGTPLELEGLFN